MNLEISNVINISVAQAGAGLGKYNTSNVALYTHEQPIVSFGADLCKMFVSPTSVATYFGTDSVTYKMALAIFTQKPNILANRGYLVIIPRIHENQTVTFDATPDEGSFVLNFGGDLTAAIPYTADAAAVQVAVRTITGLELAIVTGSFAAGFVVDFQGYAGPAALMTITSNLLELANVAVVATVTQVTNGETIGGAITRTVGLVQYFGVMSTMVAPAEAEMLADAAVLSAYNKMGFAVSIASADVEVGGKLDKLRTGTLNKYRGLYYGDTALKALIFAASYVGRLLSVNFAASNSVITMQLKDLIGIQPDPSMDQTLYLKCKAAGVDIYVSIEGVSKAVSFGANQFADQVYNLGWYIGDLQIAGFNVLAQVGTKVSQTEQGVDLLKAAYRIVNEAALKNGYFAAGKWTRADTFGEQQDFLDNIEQIGYYIYSSPISEQDPADRANRDAPVIQIAGKEAGAIHGSSVIVNINQ